MSLNLGRKLIAACFGLSHIIHLIPLSAYADTFTFSGNDSNGSEAVPLSSWPNSTRAQVDFLENLSDTVFTQNFELVPASSKSPIRLLFSRQGESTLTGLLQGSEGQIFSVPSGSTYKGSYGTSPTKFWSVVTGSSSNFSITFDRPIAAIGFNGIDIGDFDGILDVRTYKKSKLVNSYKVPLSQGISANGSVLFFGIIEDSKKDRFDKIEFDTQNTGTIADIFSFDNIIAATARQLNNAYRVRIESSLQPYAATQELLLGTLVDQQIALSKAAGKCDRYGWILYDLEQSSPAYEYLHGKVSTDWRLCLFGEGGFLNADISADDRYSGYNIYSEFLRTGLEVRLSPSLIAGAAYAYSNPKLSGFTSRFYDATLENSFSSGSLYLSYRPDLHWVLTLLGSAGNSSVSSSRNFFYSNNLFASSQANWDILLYGLSLDAAYEFYFSKTKSRYSPILRPSINYQFAGMSSPSVTERGTGQLVTVDSYDISTSMIGLGLSFEYPIKLQADGLELFIPKLVINYQLDVNGSDHDVYSVNASSLSNASRYSSSARLIGENRFSATLLGDLNLGDSFSVYAGVSYLGFDSGDGYVVEGGLRIRM